MHPQTISKKNQPRRRATQRAAGVRAFGMMERLEGRWLLAATLSGGDLIVDGTAGADVINLVGNAGGMLTVTIGASSQQFTTANVTSITINGGAGDDLITLGAGVMGSVVNGGEDNDTIISGAGNDTLSGGLGDDRYRFGDGWGIDFISESAGQGDDTLDFSGVTGNLQVVIKPLAVSDGQSSVVSGGTGIENIVGGSGNDSFFFPNNATIAGTLAGGAGKNTLTYTSYTTPVNVNLGTGAATGTEGVDDIQVVLGGSANDTLIGDASANTLSGGAGNDTLDGGGGSDDYAIGDDFDNDTILAPSVPGSQSLNFSNATADLTFTISGSGVTVSDGTHTLTASSAVKNLIGGSGNDTFIFQNGVQIPGLVNGGLGNNTLDYSAYKTAVNVNLGVGEINQNNVRIGFYGTATGTIAVRFIDNVIGGAAADVLSGNDNANRIFGGGGNDKIAGGDGADSLRGGGGNDAISGGDGDDTARGDAGNDNIRGGRGNDSLTGDAGNDVINGDSGNDKILGGAGADKLTGGSGGDAISGGAGIDSLFGKDHTRDTLDGGAARDVYTFDRGVDVLL